MAVEEHRLRKALAAMRNGEFIKADGMLRNEDGHMCALGVMCHLSGLGEWREIPTEPGRYEYVVSEDDKSIDVLPQAVAEWYGLPDKDPIVEYEDDSGELFFSVVQLNDDSHLDLKKIADVIEAEFLR